MSVFVVQGRYGELYVCETEPKALHLWAETNGFKGYKDFLNEYGIAMEFSPGRWYLDDGGSVSEVEVE